MTTLPRGIRLDDIPFQPWARAATTSRQIDQFEPHTRCKASGVSRQFSTPYGTEFVEVPDLQRMYIMDVGGPNSYRIIYMDGRSFPATITPTNYGHSIGRWEGDTLVVETRGLNEKFWIDTRGTPHTSQLTFTERFTRTDMNTLRYQATIDDPGAYTKPWTTGEFTLRWRPGEGIPPVFHVRIGFDGMTVQGDIKNPVAGNRTISGTWTRGSEKGTFQLRRL